MNNVNTEMNVLIRLLIAKGIPFEVTANIWHDNAELMICAPSVAECKIDAVSHYYSYGGQQGLIEIMAHDNASEITSDDVVGWLTAADALPYFIKARRYF